MTVSIVENQNLGDDLVVEIEGRLITVPRVVFAQSEVFQDMYSLPQQSGEVVDGSDDQHPLRLEGVKLSVFEALLRANHSQEYPLQDTLWQEVADVYELAAMWQMTSLVNRLRRRSVWLFDDDNAAEQLYLGWRWDKPDWVTDALRRFVQRCWSLSEKDIEMLGPKLASQVIHVREEMREVYGGQYGFHMDLGLAHAGSLVENIKQLQETLDLSNLRAPTSCCSSEIAF